MKKELLFSLIILSISLPTMSQNGNVCQPDSATMYFDISTNPQWYYGGVWDFSCSYDSDGLLSDMLVNVVHDEECLTRHYQFEYDSNHNQIYGEYVGYDCSGPGIEYRNVNEFQNNLLQYQLKYVFSVHKAGWTLSDSTYFHYDGMGRRTSQESFNENLVPTTAIRYEYDGNEKVTTTERFDDNQWMPTKRVTYTYSETELLLANKTETFSDGVFSNSMLISYSYDEQDNCLEVLTQKWENDSWVNVKKVINSYDANGHLTNAKLMNWRDGDFVDANRAIYELNESGYPIVVSFEKKNGDEWVEGTWVSDFSVFSESYLSRQNKELCDIGIRRLELHYSETPNPSYDVKEHPNGLSFATIHPNPASSTITITGESLRQIEITNMLGQRVATHEAEGPQATIDISMLPTGIYFVGITGENGKRCVKKVVKE